MIYADANGSLPLLPEVREHLRRRLDSPLWANPSAIHSLGGKIKGGLEKCRTIAADILGADPAHVSWNSGVSEGLSTVIQSELVPPRADKKRLYRLGIEHSVIINAFDVLAKTWGYEVHVVPVNAEGVADIGWLEREFKVHHTATAMLAGMAANNETGVIQPWEKMRDLCAQHHIAYLCDTTAWMGRMPFHFMDSGLQWAFVPGHKLGAIPGSGCLLARSPRDLKPLVFGGGQEEGLRGGTQNYLGAETVAIALQTFPKKLASVNDHNLWRKELEKDLPVGAIPIGASQPRLPGTMLIGYPGVHGQAVQIELESLDIFVTTSAACSDNEPATSKVLQAMGIPDDLGRSVVRVSLPMTASREDYLAIGRAIKLSYEKLTRLRSF